jgi:hypothetical protein
MNQLFRAIQSGHQPSLSLKDNDVDTLTFQCPQRANALIGAQGWIHFDSESIDEIASDWWRKKGVLLGNQRATRSLIDDDSDDEDVVIDGFPGQSAQNGYTPSLIYLANKLGWTMINAKNLDDSEFWGRKGCLHKLKSCTVPHHEVLEAFPESNIHHTMSLLRQESLTTTMSILCEESIASSSDSFTLPPDLEHATTYAQAVAKGRDAIMSYLTEMFPKTSRDKIEKTLMEHSTHKAVSILAERKQMFDFFKLPLQQKGCQRTAALGSLD